MPFLDVVTAAYVEILPSSECLMLVKVTVDENTHLEGTIFE